MSAVVNVIGAGLAGLSAALGLAEKGMRCRLVSAQASERSQSVLAEGGINAALNVMGEHDSPEQHFADTMRAAAFLSDPNAVWDLAKEAPHIVRMLQQMGVPFQREHGLMIQRNFGGQKKKRTAYAKSSTGKMLVSALVDAVRHQEVMGAIERLAHHELVDLALLDGVCVGVWVHDTYTGETIFLAGPVILACGGMGGMFGELTTGTTANTGDVAALCLARGVELANLEFLQYHPTTAPISGKRMLLTEAARGEGGRLFVERGGEPWYFMEEKYPELGNLMPRDVVSREEYAVLGDPACGNQVYLDMRRISPHIWRMRLSDLRDEVRHYLRIDPAREPIPVEPGIHYCMGGVLVDQRHRTNVAGLWAAGECACAYHGANRLGGNSLLGAIYGGIVAARNVGARDLPTGVGVPGAVLSACDFVPEELTMRRTLVRCMGILRSGEELAAGMRVLDELPHTARVNLARAMVACALAREESRGAHQRIDFPNTSDAFARTTVVRLEADKPVVEFRPIPAARKGVPSI